MPEPRTADDVRERIRRIRTMRWVLIGVSAALAVALVVKGNLLIGALVGLMACVRAWMLVTMPRRMRAMGQPGDEAFTNRRVS